MIHGGSRAVRRRREARCNSYWINTNTTFLYNIFHIFIDVILLLLIDLILDLREQREREAKRELNLGGQSAAKHRARGALSDRALADVALPSTQGPASQHNDELDYTTILDAERAIVGSNGTRAEEQGLVDECGGGVARKAGSGAAASSTSPSAVDLKDDGASTPCNGVSACSAIKEEAACKTTGPTIERVPKLNIRWMPDETTIETPHSRPAYQRQFGIDETAKAPSPAKRLRLVQRKSAASTTRTLTGSSATQSNRARRPAQSD